MEFSKFIEWAFYGVISGGIYIIAQSINSMKASVIELNVKLATVIEKVSYHEKALDDHHDRIRDLEKNK